MKIDLIKWYTKAAEQGISELQFVLGEYYRTGVFVNKNTDIARTYYTLSANNGYEPAKIRLEQLKSKDANSSIVQQNMGRDSLQQIKEYGELRIKYYKGEGVKKNLILAYNYLSRAADGGYLAAQYGLAMMYYRGEGVNKDLTKSLKWFLEAANQGLAEAQHEASILLYNGNGVEKNITEAVFYLKRAASQGHKKAESDLKQLGF